MKQGNTEKLGYKQFTVSVCSYMYMLPSRIIIDRTFTAAAESSLSTKLSENLLGTSVCVTCWTDEIMMGHGSTCTNP